ncbi:protein of unknown function [Streptomyces murinus]
MRGNLGNGKRVCVRRHPGCAVRMACEPSGHRMLPGADELMFSYVLTGKARAGVPASECRAGVNRA